MNNEIPFLTIFAISDNIMDFSLILNGKYKCMLLSVCIEEAYS